MKIGIEKMKLAHKKRVAIKVGVADGKYAVCGVAWAGIVNGVTVCLHHTLCKHNM